ncbi:hypothetical protein EBS80_00530 [bacterium]|nr:hypothetical protein [bacterium]
MPVKREHGRIPTTLADVNETPNDEPAEIVPDTDEELDEDGNPIVPTEEATEEDEQRATPLDEELVVAMPEVDPEDTNLEPRLRAELPVEDLEERVRVIPPSTNDAKRDEGDTDDEGDAPEFMERDTQPAA